MMSYDTKEVIYRIETELDIDLDEIGNDAFKKLHGIIRDHEIAIEDKLTEEIVNAVSEFNPRFKR